MQSYFNKLKNKKSNLRNLGYGFYAIKTKDGGYNVCKSSDTKQGPFLYFYEVEPFDNFGFIRCYSTKEDYENQNITAYIDRLGNFSRHETLIGQYFNGYANGKYNVFDLTTECFGDSQFLNYIMSIEIQTLQNKNYIISRNLDIDNSDRIKQCQELADEAEFIGEYIKDKAYEARLIQIEESKERDRKSRENEEKLVEACKAIQQVDEAIEKMF